MKVNSRPIGMMSTNMLLEAPVHESLFAGGTFVVDGFGVHLFHMTFDMRLLLARLAAYKTDIAQETLLRLEEHQRFQIHLRGIYNRVVGRGSLQEWL